VAQWSRVRPDLRESAVVPEGPKVRRPSNQNNHRIGLGFGKEVVVCCSVLPILAAHRLLSVDAIALLTCSCLAMFHRLRCTHTSAWPISLSIESASGLGKKWLFVVPFYQSLRLTDFEVSAGLHGAQAESEPGCNVRACKPAETSKSVSRKDW
jgi:hypothetical protein